MVESVEQMDHQKFPNKVFVTMQVNVKEEKFQIDTGATVDIMSDETFAVL